LKHGEKIAVFIKDKNDKNLLRPLFEYFAMKGKELKYGL